jgi:hypothetical protein
LIFPRLYNHPTTPLSKQNPRYSSSTHLRSHFSILLCERFQASRLFLFVRRKAYLLATEMKKYADRCTSNLACWMARCKELQAQTTFEIPPPLTHPRHPDDYMSAFPLTLPPSHRTPQTEDHTLIWPTSTYSRSSDSSSGSSESKPCSPCESVSSSTFSPASETSNPRPPSSAGSSSGSGVSHSNGNLLVLDGHAAIRAAGQLGIRRQKSMNRNSWSPYSVAGQPRAAVTLLVSTGTTPMLAPEKQPTETIVVKPIKFEKSKLSKV